MLTDKLQTLSARGFWWASYKEIHSEQGGTYLFDRFTEDRLSYSIAFWGEWEKEQLWTIPNLYRPFFFKI